MSMIYEMSEHSSEVLAKVKEGKVSGLTHRHQPIDPHTKQESLWPDGVEYIDHFTSIHTHGWFEGSMILFWGTNDPTNILAMLNHAGIKTTYIG